MLLIRYANVAFNEVDEISYILRTEIQLCWLTLNALVLGNCQLWINWAKIRIRMHYDFICSKREHCGSAECYIGDDNSYLLESFP